MRRRPKRRMNGGGRATTPRTTNRRVMRQNGGSRDCWGGEVELWGQCYDPSTTTTIEIGPGSGCSGPIPTSINQLPYLEVLSLRNCGGSGPIPTSIAQLPLQSLNLRDNSFSGTIPSNLTNLPLEYLDLSNNQFSGTIPSNIGNLSSTLRVLRLDHNQLTGTIPASIGNLSCINGGIINQNWATGVCPTSYWEDDLTLNNNRLTGPIPESLCAFASYDEYGHPSPNGYWDYLSLHSNKLCPPYPSCFPNSVLKAWTEFSGGHKHPIYWNENSFCDRDVEGCTQPCDPNECGHSDWNYEPDKRWDECSTYGSGPNCLCQHGWQDTCDCPLLGDTNQDQNYDVLDIIQYANHIMAGYTEASWQKIDCPVIESNCTLGWMECECKCKIWEGCEALDVFPEMCWGWEGYSDEWPQHPNYPDVTWNTGPGTSYPHCSTYTVNQLDIGHCWNDAQCEDMCEEFCSIGGSDLPFSNEDVEDMEPKRTNWWCCDYNPATQGAGTFTNEQLQVADINYDGTVDITDVIALLQRILGEGNLTSQQRNELQNMLRQAQSGNLRGTGAGNTRTGRSFQSGGRSSFRNSDDRIKRQRYDNRGRKKY